MKQSLYEESPIGQVDHHQRNNSWQLGRSVNLEEIKRERIEVEQMVTAMKERRKRLIEDKIKYRSIEIERRRKGPRATAMRIFSTTQIEDQEDDKYNNTAAGVLSIRDKNWVNAPS